MEQLKDEMDKIGLTSNLKKLSLINLNKSFGDNHVVKDLSLKVDQGEFVVLLGPSGCGKTTALRMIAGLESVDSGEIEIGDSVVTHQLPKYRNISMVFQSYALYPHKTVGENIAFPLKVRGIKGNERDKSILEAAKQVHMEDYLNRYPRQLSGGQRQRVALARAIVRQPDVFLMDEPLSNLDAKLRVHMRTELKRMQHEMGITTVYVTHDQVEAMTLANRVAIMNEGILQQIAPPKEIYNNPKNVFVAGFMGSPAMNLIRGSTNNSKMIVLGKEFKLNENIENHDNLLGIRPEHASITEKNKGFFKGKVFTTEQAGDHTLINLNLSDQSMIVKMPSDYQTDFDTELAVTFSMENTYLFYKDSGERIEAKIIH